MKYFIDEKLTLTIGRIPQSVRIRSTDESLPVLLFLHGGPGVCDRHWVLGNQSQLARIATMVCWDQRGAGLSWSSKLKKEDMKIARCVEDAHELISYLKRRFRKSAVYVVGHSWGQRHLRYLRQYRRICYVNLLTTGRLPAYLAEVDWQAQEMFTLLTEQYAAAEGVTEQLKAENQLEWARRMNSIRDRVTEVIHRNLIYA